MPGEIGTVIPEAATIAVRRQDTIQHPGFCGRTLSGPANPWFRRVRLGGFNSGGHGPGWRSSPQKEPQLYMTENGKRTGKLDVAHPEVLRRTVELWHALGVKMMYRGYLFNLADAGLPFSMIGQIRSEYPYYHERGMIACRVECKPAWSYHGPPLYLAAKIMWDPMLDVDALLDDYFTRFYGPAGDAMRRHFDRLERAYTEADYHTGNTLDIPHILTPAVMRDLEQSLRSAEQAAATGSSSRRHLR